MNPSPIARRYAEQIVLPAATHTTQEFAHDALDERDERVTRTATLVQAAINDAMAGVNAALNMDLYPGKDAETVARKLSHDLADAQFAARGALAKVKANTPTVEP